MRAPIPIRPRYCVGLDLGKMTDYSALATLRFMWPWQTMPIYEVPVLKRWPLGSAYLEIVADVAKFLKTLSADGEYPLLVVDATGVGNAVLEMVELELARARVPCNTVGVTITAGSAVSQVPELPGRWRVSKKMLVSVLQVLLGHRRLQIAETLPEAKTLQRELGTFSERITQSLNETYEAIHREGAHDDLVLAVALPAWACEYLDIFKPPEPEPVPVKPWWNR